MAISYGRRSLLLPRSPGKASHKHLLLFPYLLEHLASVLTQHHHYMRVLADRLRDARVSIDHLSKDNNVLWAQAGRRYSLNLNPSHLI
ncbi:hypothetical protein B296_00041613 [Ensete ventricosum]|uniref:Uncharacterized protein n=1 Tax=Ensete ventricosum TaxID=4639 RepID=A0A426YYV4_ENSVE|nr:hypothetical protein B296_00041613 [Ensete ventricosum]